MSYVVTVQCRSRTAGRHAHAGRPRRPQLTQGDCINISTFLVFSAVGASLQQPAVGVTTSEYGVFVHDARPPAAHGITIAWHFGDIRRVFSSTCFPCLPAIYPHSFFFANLSALLWGVVHSIPFILN
jgi:hypothetical protein